MLEEFTENEYARIGTLIETMANQPGTRAHTRAVAERLFDLQTVGVERYAALYERVY